MTDQRFSAADLEPSDDDRRASRRALVERIAATVAVLAVGVWLGGMVALGACAAPFVFRLTPAPFNGNAMGAAFARFDHIALGAAALVLGAEVARTWARLRKPRTIAARIRRLAGILMACSAAYVGLAITPGINGLHREGVTRGVGDDGARLERLHARAELVGKLDVVLGLALVGLHVFTLSGRRPEDDDEEDAFAPLPPGPAA
jgi:hypothetical protein